MKRLLTIGLAFVLAGCGALAPNAAQNTPVVQTVIVTVIPTQAPTEAPSATAAPTQTPQIIVVTATGQGAAAPAGQTTETPQATEAAAATSAATATLPANAGGELFTNLTRSSDHFALKCQPETITFGVSTDSPYAAEVDLFYRIEDRLSTSVSEWKDGGKMTSDHNGNFTIDFSAATVDPDLRSHKAWFDYQFVAINKYGDALGRSAKIVKQITYIIDCGD